MVAKKMVDAEDLVAARKLSGDLNLGARGETGSRKKKHGDVEELR